MNQHGNVVRTIGAKVLKETSEYRELSQESQSSEHFEQMPRKVVKRTFSKEMQPEHSESREHSQNSRIKQVGVVEVTVTAENTKHSAAKQRFSRRFSKLTAKW